MIQLLTVCSALGGFLFGYDTGVVSGALLLIQVKLKLNTFQLEMIVSATVFGAILGAYAGGTLTQKYGRKPAIVLSTLLFAFGAVYMSIANGYVGLLTGRFIVGLAVGIASMSVPMYIAEAAPSDRRGVLVSINTLFITGGQFFASIVDGIYSSEKDGWRMMLGLGAVPAVIQCVGFYFLPESPRYLVHRGRLEEGRQALMQMRGNGNVEQEMKSLIEEFENGQESRMPWNAVLGNKSHRRALMLGCMLQALQQLAGINTVMYYSATIIQMAGFTKPSMAIWLASIVAFSNFIFTILGLYLVDRVGRRPLTIGSLFGVSLCLFALGLSFYLAETNAMAVQGIGVCEEFQNCFDCVANAQCGVCPGKGTCMAGNASYAPCIDFQSATCPNGSKTAGWVIVLCLFTYLAFFAPGMGPMPWTINAEIYPQSIRSWCISVSTSVNWIFNLLVSLTFLSFMKTFTTYGAFWMYSAVAMAGTLYLYKHLPETKGLPLEAIESLFQRQAQNDKQQYTTVTGHYI